MDEATATRGPGPRVGWLVDVGVCAFVLAVGVPLVREAAAMTGAAMGVATANAVVHGAVLLARRWRPMGVVAVLGVTAVVHVSLGMPVAFLGPAALVGVYTVAARCRRHDAVAVLLAALAGLVVGTVVGDVRPSWDSLALYTVLLTAAWWLGDTVHRRQEEAAAHAARAEELQQARLELARTAVAEERLRIARELHDVIVHSLTAVSVHAGTARLALDNDADGARAALGTIESTTRGALAELRQLLGVLRDPGGPEGPTLAPAPRLERLSELLDEVRQDGLAVELAVDGDLTGLPAGLDLSAYRIVQEALTNTRRHAGAQKADVSICRRSDALVITVTDDGRGGTDPLPGPGGHGLLGMRERVAIYGGALDAGAAPSGGFCVRARLPLPAGGR